jgi:hypothetical protein
MIVNSKQEEQTGKKFSKVLKPYLEEYDSRIVSLEKHDRSSRKLVHLGEQVKVPASDITHLFSNQAMLAVSHAIEDLASDVREGELISTFQHFDNFKPQKKRYIGLAKDLDAVRVWGEGNPPKRCPRVDFIPVFREELKRYWVVLFSSPHSHAALVCCQVNKSKDFNRKVFAGFYTFNPFVVESIRRQFNLMSIGLDRMVKSFDRQFNIPSLSLKEIEDYFQTSGQKPEA